MGLTRKTKKAEWKLGGTCWRRNHEYEIVGAVVYLRAVWVVFLCKSCPRIWKLRIKK